MQELFVGGETGDSKWRCHRYEWLLPSNIHAHGCRSGNTELRELFTDLFSMFLRRFIERRRRGEGGRQGKDEGVSYNKIDAADEENERVQLEVLSFLGNVGMIVHNPDSPVDGVPISKDQQQRGFHELAKYMADSRGTTRRRCLKDIACLSAPVRSTSGAIRTILETESADSGSHTLAVRICVSLRGLSTDCVEDWQAEIMLPRSSLPPKGEEWEGGHDGCVNRHVLVQLLKWEANIDSSFIVDREVVYR